MAYEAQGRIVAIYQTVQRSEKFRTREFVIEVTEELRERTITNYIKFQLVQDRTAIMDSFKVGDMIKVQFNIKGSKWERDGQTNYISNLDAWRVEQIGMPAAAPPAGMPGTAPGFGPAPAADAADDLPF
jgi:hypothetical protein